MITITDRALDENRVLTSDGIRWMLRNDEVTVLASPTCLQIFFRDILPTKQCVHGTGCKTDGASIYTDSMAKANKCLDKYYAGKMKSRKIDDEQSRLANSIKEAMRLIQAEAID